MAKIENISNTRMVDTSNYLPATQLYIKNVEDYLLGKYGEIKPVWVGLLDSLAFQYDIFQMSKEAIRTNGMVTQTSRGLCPNPSIKIMNDASIQVGTAASSMVFRGSGANAGGPVEIFGTNMNCGNSFGKMS